MIVVLCGPPASGKTTLAARLRQRLADRGYAFEILHSDDFSRRTYERMYERVEGSDADWILGGTFYEREHQRRSRALDEASLVWVRVSRETALARNRDRADPISDTGVHVVHSTFDRPCDPDLTIDTDALSVAEALDRLESAVLSWLDGEQA